MISSCMAILVECECAYTCAYVCPLFCDVIVSVSPPVWKGLFSCPSPNEIKTALFSPWLSLYLYSVSFLLFHLVINEIILV